MRAANITTAIAAAIWLGFVLMGRGLEGGVAGRTGGNVNIVQFDYYVLWPTYVVVALLVCAWTCNYFRRWYGFLALISSVSLLLLLPFLFLYGGGV